MRNILTPLTLAIALVSPLLQAKPAEECLGRLVFTVPDINNFEWAVVQDETAYSAFSKKIYTGDSNWYYDQFLITSTTPTEKRWFDYQFKNYEISRRVRINGIEKELETTKSLLKHLTKLRKKQQQELAQGKTFKHYEIIQEEEIKKYQYAVNNLQEQLDYLAKHPLIKVPLDYPDAFTVYNDTAYFWRDNRIYTFANTTRKAPPLSELNQRLAGFSPRQLGEIPKSLGFCFPYGFMADAGDTDYEIKNAFRFKDQPNVLYAFYTGTVRHGKIDILNNPMLVELGKVAKYGFADNGISLKIANFQDHKQQQTISLGELGEIELTIDSMIEKNPVDPKDPVTAYIITGAIRDTYDNKVADKTKPYIGFQIYGYPKNTGEDYNLPQNPPTPEQAIEKVMPLVKTLRLGLQSN